MKILRKEANPQVTHFQCKIQTLSLGNSALADNGLINNLVTTEFS